MADDFVLHRAIIRFATGVAKGKIREEESRNTTLFDDVPSGSDDHRRDAIRLQCSCDQTHGLVTHGSVSAKYRDIHPVFAHPLEYLRRVGLHRDTLRAVGGCAIEPGSQCADASCLVGLA